MTVPLPPPLPDPRLPHGSVFPLPSYRKEPPPARVPRRFGVGTVMIFTAMFAVLFSLLRSLGSPPHLIIFLGLWSACIGLGQMLLFGGKQPRAASVAVGVPSAILILVAMLLWEVASNGGINTAHADIAGMICAMVFGGLLSVPGSYALGCAMAGVFLLIDRWRTGRWNPEPEESDPPAVPCELVSEDEEEQP